MTGKGEGVAHELCADDPGDLSTESTTGQSDLQFGIAIRTRAQTQAMIAQAQVVSLQILPPFSCYSDESSQRDDKGVDHWLELFEERAQLAGWTDELNCVS